VTAAPLLHRAARRVGYGTAYCAGVYLATRAAVALGVVVAYLLHPSWSWHHILTRDDAWWYEYIAAHGYGSHLRLHVPGDAFHSRFSTWAFYPGYPLLIRGVHELTQLPYTITAFLLAFVLAGIAVRAVYGLGEAVGGLPVARGSAALIAAWPGSAAMNLPYSEGLFIAAAAGSLTALLRRHWLLAGALGAVASGTRAIGLAVVAGALVAAGQELRTSRSWRPLLAPLGAASGVAAFYLYGWQQTGDPLVWRHAEDRWRQRLDFGAAVIHRLTHDFALRGGHAAGTLLLAVGLAMFGLMLVAAIVLGPRLQAPLVAYSVVSGALVICYSGVGPRPRMILAIVPGFVWLAQWLRPRLVEMVTVGMASTLALTAYLYASLVVP
jgi:hypothetical protein